jgi:two-component system sensor histidine kinase QseC
VRLLAGVLAAVAAAWIAVAWTGYRQARRELDELLDAHLAQFAALLVAQLSEEHDDDDHEEEEDDDDELELEHAPRLHPYTRHLAFQVWERGRRLRLHSRLAPDTRLSPDDDGFSEAAAGGERWRVFSAWTRDRRLLVQVGERAAARDAVAREIAGHLLLPLGIALPLLGLALAVAIGRALRPLRALADAVGRRDPERLQPVAALAVPREVAPLVERLNALFARIAASLERERAFTADAAHELRTPLAAIRAQAQVARQATRDDERRHALDQVIAGCDRAARLAEQLLTLARLDAEGWQGRFAACDLAEIARDELAALAPRAHERGVALELAAEGAAPVRGEAALLGILLRNLADNAVRHSPRHGTVQVRVAPDSAGVRLAVSDEGPGIPPAERARVLDRFYRLLGGDETGAGLGLSIAARIAALHGATLALDDAPGGRGLLITVRFPETPPGAPAGAR